MNNYQLLAEYVSAKRLSKSTCGEDGLELYCYTKQEFFDKDNWDAITTSHRGKLYSNGVSVNNPMSKIFNIGERPETSLELVSQRIANEPYEIYDKANGHLYFCSVFHDEKISDHLEYVITTHTKGSLDSEMIDADDVIFDAHGYPDIIKGIVGITGINHKCINEPPKNVTFMFEAIVEHDKHTLYEQMCSKYSKNDFVLLAVIIEYQDGTVEDLAYKEVHHLAQRIGCHVVSRETVAFDFDAMKSQQQIEGYVIRFNDGTRVKIKTDDYWKLRLEKELRPEVILGKWRKGGSDRVRNDIPEELAEKAITVIESWIPAWLERNYIRRDSRGGYLVDVIPMKYSDMSHAEIMYVKGQFTEERVISVVSKSKAMRTEMINEVLTDEDAMTTLATVITNHLHNPEGSDNNE